MQQTNVLIIGGGITGLSLASFIGDDYLIVEKDSEVGGYCKTTIRKRGNFFATGKYCTN